MPYVHASISSSRRALLKSATSVPSRHRIYSRPCGTVNSRALRRSLCARRAWRIDLSWMACACRERTRRSLMLVSGRFAMLDDGLGFSLVPWRPAIERQLGRTLSAVVRGGTTRWDLGRQRGLSL